VPAISTTQCGDLEVGKGKAKRPKTSQLEDDMFPEKLGKKL